MPTEVIYLEYTEAVGSSHKFYEVTIDDTKLTIRYGRIGEAGQSSSSSFATFEDAKKAGEKKAAEKRKKGYANAVLGATARKSRTVTRRPIASHSPAPVSRNAAPIYKAPTIWKFASGSAAFGIYVNEKACWMGNQDGSVFALDHEGNVMNQYRLPDGVKCLVADQRWIYAGCDNGNVYDLTGKVTRVAYEVNESVDIYWLDIWDAFLAVSDEQGNVLVGNYEDESHWSQKSSGSGGWMVRADANGIYHGHSGGVTCYALADGAKQWDAKTKGGVLFGWQEKDAVYAGCGDSKVYAFGKDGSSKTVYNCDGTIYSCATAEGGKFVFAGDSYSSIYCFAEDGTRLWKLSTGCGSALSMQYFQERLYIVTGDGTFACIDVTEQSIEDAKQGNAKQAVAQKAPAAVAVANTSHLDTISDTSTGVLLKCVKENSKLRVKVESAGYHADWNVQFPKDLRQEGVQYIVPELVESASGGFYRVVGDIKKVI